MNLFEEAAEFALQAHSGQVRKKARTPFILHPMEAAAITATMTDDEEVLAAAILHDTVEDTDVTLDELEEKFGRRVRDLVAAETENKYRDRPAGETWMIRKEESLKELEQCCIEAKMIWLGDKLSNMRSFYRAYLDDPDTMWDGFHMKDPDKQYWYYSRIAECLKELERFPAYQEYISLMNIIFTEGEQAEWNR